MINVGVFCQRDSLLNLAWSVSIIYFISRLRLSGIEALLSGLVERCSIPLSVEYLAFTEVPLGKL